MKFFRPLALALALVAALGVIQANAVTYTFNYAVWPNWVVDTTNNAVSYLGGLFQFGAATSTPVHVSSAQTTAPALTSCGTSPSISGSDTAGTVTMGTGTPTGCVITFNAAYNTAPHCNVTWRATPLASQSYTVSATAITLTQTATSSNLADYTCVAPAGG